MPNMSGRLLVAMPSLLDPNFSRTVIHVFEHDEENGAVGLILNRPSDLVIKEYLPDLSITITPPDVVFIGGPVAREFALTVVIDAEGNPTLASDPVGEGVGRVFSGYSGWGAGQLESEIAEGAWFVTRPEPGEVLTSDPSSMWSAVLRRQQGVVRLLATFPADLSSN